MSSQETVLVDAAETKRRLLQNGLLLAGAVLFVVGIPLLAVHDGRHAGAAALVAGIVSFASGVRLRIGWEAAYKGHAVRFENHPIFGECLILDGRRIRRGALGFVKTLEGTIEGGDGAGDRIVAVSKAGLTRFACRIVATSGRDV